MRAVLPLAAIVALALLMRGCGGDEDTLESLAGTPAAVHIVNDVEAMAHACKKQTHKAREAGVNGFTNLAKITSIHPQATFGPEGTDVDDAPAPPPHGRKDRPLHRRQRRRERRVPQQVSAAEVASSCRWTASVGVGRRCGEI